MMGERRIIPITPNKRRAPALYELISPGSATKGPDRPAGSGGGVPAPSKPAAPGSPGSAAQVAAGNRADAPSREDEERVLGISPGSRLNLPIGFAFVAMAIVIAVVIGAYALGYSKREKEYKQKQELDAAREPGMVKDPLAGLIDPSAPAPGAGAVPSQAPVDTRAEPQVEPPRQSGAQLYVVKSSKDDPRKAGVNYPTVATLPFKEASAAGQFLVAKGYSVALVPAPRDPKLLMVVPLIGLDRDGFRRDKDSIERTLKELGRSYKRDQKGASDFFDLFWVKK